MQPLHQSDSPFHLNSPAVERTVQCFFVHPGEALRQSVEHRSLLRDRSIPRDKAGTQLTMGQASQANAQLSAVGNIRGHLLRPGTERRAEQLINQSAQALCHPADHLKLLVRVRTPRLKRPEHVTIP